MEQDLKEVQNPPVKDQVTQVIQETRNLHQKDFGDVERGVRALIGVPLVFSFMYVRHFSLTEAVLLLLGGLYLTFTAAFHYCAVRHLVYWLRWKQG